MKKILILSTLLFIGLATTTNAQTTVAPTAKQEKTDKKENKKKNDNKDKKDKKNKPEKLKGGGDGIDDRMKGPNGEAVLIGKKGGRYYLSPTGEKVYLQRAKSYKKGKK